MKLSEISNIRLASQRIEPSAFENVKKLVSWMGAMQSQDFAMAKWAIGARINGATNETVEAAFNKGEIIRTHLMRPTWHIISSDDIHWMLELTAPRIKSLMKSRNYELGLSDEVILKTNGIIEKALSEKEYLTREELTVKFNTANIKTDENRLSHILVSAELDGVVCSGPANGNKQTYALLSKRAPNRKVLNKDEALAELAKRYFTSHGPATLKDFTWWSGLSVTEARKALDFVKSDFISETVNSEDYWFSGSLSEFRKNKSSVYFLPAYDEFLISYTNRSASISQVENPKAISNNGIFRPVIIENGQVIAIWKRTIKKDNVIIEIDFFTPPDEKMKLRTEEAAIQFGIFLNKKTDVRFPAK